MMHSGRFTVVLDACVLYPAPLRDYLLNLADASLYKPKWSNVIMEEWIRNLLANREDLDESRLRRTVSLMNEVFPDGNVQGFEGLISSLNLPDSNDNHVLAVAIRCNADVIITSNIKDFPSALLLPFDLEAQHPDFFVSNLIDLDPLKSVEAFQNQVENLKNPIMTEEQVLEKLAAQGLVNSVEYLRQLIFS
jgi:predicted nucleic acid-binding protein